MIAVYEFATLLIVTSCCWWWPAVALTTSVNTHTHIHWERQLERGWVVWRHVGERLPRMSSSAAKTDQRELGLSHLLTLSLCLSVCLSVCLSQRYHLSMQLVYMRVCVCVCVASEWFSRSLSGDSSCWCARHLPSTCQTNPAVHLPTPHPGLSKQHTLLDKLQTTQDNKYTHVLDPFHIGN